MEMPKCHICGGPIGPREEVDQAVWGWQRKAGVRASGKHGGSDIRCRRTFERFAHSACVDLAQDGIAVGQTTLV